MWQGFGKDHTAPGKGGEVSIQLIILVKSGNIYSQFLMKFTVVTAHVCCVQKQQMKINFLKKTGLNK